MRVAIFGANGYMGRHTCHYLSSQGIGCCGFDVQGSTVGEDHFSSYKSCNVTDDLWWRSFNPLDYAAIFFLSGMSGPERSFKEASLYENVNVGGLLNLLQRMACLGANAPKIIFPSSRLVYKGGGVVTEDSPLEPRSVYAANKVACEGLLSAYYHRYGLPFVALRICVPYGNLLSKEYSYGTLGFFMQQVRSGKPITVYGDGSLRKTYTHIGDICSIFYRVMMCREAQGIYNIGGYDYSLKEVAELVAQKNGGRIEFLAWPESASRVEMGDISLVASKLDGVIGAVQYKRMEDCVNEF